VIGAGIGAGAAFAGIDPVIHFAVMAVVLVAGAIVVVRWVPSDDTLAGEETDHAKATFGERMGIWLNPRTLLIGLIVLGMAFTEGSANDWLAIGFIDDRGFDNGQGALVFGVFTVAMTIGRLGGVPLLDRFGRVPVLRGAALAAAIGIAIVILVPIVPIAIAGVVLWGLGASLGFPVGMSAAADDPKTAAASVSAVATIGYAAFLIGPPLIGFVGDQIGILNALWIVLGLIVVATLAVPAAREPEKRAAREAARAGSLT
jgi:cyanate permease